MGRITAIDREVLSQMSGGDKIKALLKARGFSLKDFAKKYNQWVSDVSRCIGGHTTAPEIRESLAEELGLTREEVDALIDGVEAEAA